MGPGFRKRDLGLSGDMARSQHDPFNYFLRLAIALFIMRAASSMARSLDFGGLTSHHAQFASHAIGGEV